MDLRVPTQLPPLPFFLRSPPPPGSVVIPKDDMLFTTSPDKLRFYRTEDQRTVHELPCKLSCGRCHSPIADEGRNMMLMYPSTWNFAKFEDRQAWLPDKHIFYAQRALDVEDGMPKWEKMQDESELMDEEHHHGQKGIAGSGSKVSEGLCVCGWVSGWAGVC